MKYAKLDKNGFVEAFYDTEVNGEKIPKDTVQISDAQYNELLNNQNTKAYIEDAVVDVEKPIVIDYADALKSISDAKKVGGFELNGIKIKTDFESVQSLREAAKEAEKKPDLLIDWLTENGWLELTAPVLIALSDYVFKHVQSCFSARKVVDLNIGDFESLEEMKTAYDTAYDTAMNS